MKNNSEEEDLKETISIFESIGKWLFTGITVVGSIGLFLSFSAGNLDDSFLGILGLFAIGLFTWYRFWSGKYEGNF